MKWYILYFQSAKDAVENLWVDVLHCFSKGKLAKEGKSESRRSCQYVLLPVHVSLLMMLKLLVST